MNEEFGEKELNREAMAVSVIEHPPPPNGNQPYPGQDSSLFWFVSGYADEIQAWGTATKLRDKQLRSFITHENMFASSLGIVASRNASFSWSINGPESTVTRMQDVLESANSGEGWEDLIIKTSLDLYTQDFGAFWEIVRESERAPVLAINHLDAARCWHTGAPEAPVIYQDRLGKYHLLKWFQVVTFAEMPVPIEGMYGMQYCALTRLLRAVQIRKNILTRDYERTGGRNTKAIILVKGVTSKQINDAMVEARLEADSQGLMRHMNPVVVGTIDPKADVGHDTIELTGMPEDYDAEVFFKEYIAQISMAFLSDYQEFAPLPGGNLGTSTQSQILHMKNHGKGPGLFRKMITHALNFRILPRNCDFVYADQDFEAEKTEAEVKKLRAQTREIRIRSMELTPEAARQIANDEGDLRQDIMRMMGDADVTENVGVDDDTTAQAQLQGKVNTIQKPSNASPTTRPPTSAARRPAQNAR